MVQFLTHSVRQDLQSDHPLIAVQLQAIDTVEAVVFDQVERRIHWDLVQDSPLPLRGLTWEGGTDRHTHTHKEISQEFCSVLHKHVRKGFCYISVVKGQKSDCLF